MIKNGFKEIIESKTNIMLQSFSIAKECAIELLDKKEIDDNLRTKLYELLSLQSLLKDDRVGNSFNLIKSLMADCSYGDELNYLSFILLNALRSEDAKLKFDGFAAILTALKA